MDKRDIEWEVLFRRMYGTITEQEEEQFCTWYRSSALHRDYYSRMQQEWAEPGRYASDIARLIAEFDTLFDSRIRRRKRVGLARAAAAVAAIITVVGVGVWGLRQSGATTALSDNNTPAQTISPGQKKAILILADGRVIDIDQKSLSTPRIPQVPADAIMPQMSLGVAASHELTADEPYHTVIIPRGGEHSFDLPDGTSVRLNAETTLRFPPAFSGSERRVILSGEAYFSVTPDPAHPFIVETDMGEVEVYGTDFNVRTYPGSNSIETTLVSGSVEYTNTLNESVRLQPGDQAQYAYGDSGTRIVQVDVSKATSWINSVFSFEKEPLREIMATLARWYDIEVVFMSTELGELCFSGSIDRYDDFQSCREIFEASAPVRFEIEERRVTIRDKK